MKFSSIFFISIFFLFQACTSKVNFDATLPPVVMVQSDLLLSEISTAINTDPNANGTRTHYVELYNGTGNSTDLSNYAIGYLAVTDTATLSNFTFPTSTFFITLRGNLTNGKCYVIASPQADPIVIKRDTIWGTTSTTAAAASSPLQLSGNSAIALLKKDASGTQNLGGVMYRIIDVFGSPLVPRVTSLGATSTRNNIMWTIAGETRDTRNRTFWRKISVKDPTVDWATAKGTTTDNGQWRMSADRAWDYTNIGLPSM